MNRPSTNDRSSNRLTHWVLSTSFVRSRRRRKTWRSTPAILNKRDGTIPDGDKHAALEHESKFASSTCAKASARVSSHMKQPTPPNTTEVVDAILNSDAIADSTRLAVCSALDLARANGRAFPTPLDCIRAAVAEKASIGATCGAWGYVRNEDEAGEWLNVRESYLNPEHDERRGYFGSAEALSCFMVFTLFTRTPIPFQFSYLQRRPPRRPRSRTTSVAR